MRYVYEDREGKQEDFAQSLPESVMHNFGYKFIGHLIGGKLHSAERGRRVRATQMEAFDRMLNDWPADKDGQTSLWSSV